MAKKDYEKIIQVMFRMINRNYSLEFRLSSVSPPFWTTHHRLHSSLTVHGCTSPVMRSWCSEIGGKDAQESVRVGSYPIPPNWLCRLLLTFVSILIELKNFSCRRRRAKHGKRLRLGASQRFRPIRF